ncbi:hypothetical protein [Bradyrhizobium sp. Ash2021]
MATPSPATLTVLKMPVAIPARSGGTTLIESPSINPRGMAVPNPVTNIG